MTAYNEKRNNFYFCLGWGQTKDIAAQRLTDSFEWNFWVKNFIISSC